MYNLLRGCCLWCHKFKIDKERLAKYNAKFRLLEYGLLDDAQKVDELTRQVRFREKAPRDTKGKGKAAGEGEEEEEEEEVVMQGNDDVEDETEVAFLTRLELFVMVTIARQVAVGAKRGSYKDGLVYQYRKDLITEFLKATILNKCQNCRIFAYSFRKEGHTKVIEYDLSVKQKKSISKKRPDVLTLEKTIAHAAKHKADVALQEIDEDAEMMSDPADSEGEGDSIGEEDEEEEGDDAEEPKDSDGKPLPRAANGKVKTKRGRNERVMAAEECRAHLRRLFRNESAMCALLYGKHSSYAKVNPQGYCLASADMFFLDVIPVAPTRFRPPAKMNEILFEHPQNELLARVLNTAYRLRDLNIDLRTASQKGEEHDEEKRKKVMEQLLAALIQLQVDVNSFMDSSKNPQPVRQGKLPPAGVKQGLEKKEGLFRKHMMGKRVNYAARSVISLDVNIEPSEIGVPPVFARKLTFPEPVTPANFHEMRARVINGPRGYPGATMVEYEDGTQLSLDKLSVDQRTAIANQLLTSPLSSPSSA